MKICNCYKNKIIKILNEKNDIQIIDIVPDCEHKEQILSQLKTELMLLLATNNINPLKIIGGLKK